MKGNFALIWDRLLRSSLWLAGSKEARLVWITLLVLKNQDGDVFTSMVGLADAAKLTREECTHAIEELMAPDPDSYTKDHEGRRILPIEGGWHIVNHDLYRFSTEAKRLFWAEQKATQRAKKKPKKEPPISAASRDREARYVEAVEAGDQELADRIAAEGLPEEPTPPPVEMPELP